MRQIRFERKLATETRYVNIATQTITFGNTLSETLLATADSPDPSIESDGTNIAQVENNSYILGSPVYIQVAGTTTVTEPIEYDILIYKDAAYGGHTDQADPAVVLQTSNTDVIKSVKANKIMFRRRLITGNHDVHQYKLRIPRRLRFLRDGESIKILFKNNDNDASIQVLMHGAFVTRHS